MKETKPIGYKEAGYVLAYISDDHSIWQSASGRYSIYRLGSDGKYRSVKSNIRSIEDAIEFTEQLEGRINLEELDLPVTATLRSKKGVSTPVESIKELGLRHPLTEAEEWAKRQIKAGKVMREVEKKPLHEAGEVLISSGEPWTYLRDQEKYRVFRSPRGRFSFETKGPLRVVRSGLGEEELRRMITQLEKEGNLGEDVSYQIPFNID